VADNQYSPLVVLTSLIVKPMNRKLILSKMPYFVSSRIQEGIPMLPTDNMNLIIKGILAQASALFPVEVCHFIFMANHFHLIFVTKDPEDATAFVGYVKTEIAHAINRMLERRQHSVWVEGFDSPVMLDSETVINKIVYLYANPAEASLVDSISEYPGVSSWSAYTKNKSNIQCCKVSRDRILPLKSKVLTVKDQQDIARSLYKKGKKIELELTPDAWAECFGEGEVNIVAANEEIKKRLSALEERYRSARGKEGKKAIGAYRLKLQSIFKKYTPKKFGKKMLCLASDRATRIPFIQFFKEQCQLAKEAYEAWKVGDFSKKIPPGMFSPRPPNLLCCLQT